MMPAMIVSPGAAPAELGHERAVDLHDVDREPAQVVERRVAGAEVVDREQHAGVLELAERRQREVGVLEQRALGDLEAEAGRDPTPASRSVGADPVDEVGLRELARRQVHRERRAARSSVLSASHASSTTRQPIGTMSPDASAAARNWSGPSRPRCGCSQRRSAFEADGRPRSRGRRSAGSAGAAGPRRARGAARSRSRARWRSRRAAPRRTPRSGSGRAPWPGTPRRRRTRTSSPPVEWSSATAIPMLAVTKTSRPCSSNGVPERQRDAVREVLGVDRRLHVGADDDELVAAGAGGEVRGAQHALQPLRERDRAGRRRRRGRARR